MPTIRDVMNWDEMPPQELEEKRRGFLSLVKERQEKKAKGETLPPEVQNQEPPLTDTELHNWLEITRQLRKRNSGPAKAPKKPKGQPITSADLF